ncbi:MAG: hypothetical protein AVDCRST_MAG11-1411, partial [uncultured Gemmatimonadaceae bacterium]
DHQLRARCVSCAVCGRRRHRRRGLAQRTAHNTHRARV